MLFSSLAPAPNTFPHTPMVYQTTHHWQCCKRGRQHKGQKGHRNVSYAESRMDLAFTASWCPLSCTMLCAPDSKEQPYKPQGVGNCKYKMHAGVRGCCVHATGHSQHPLFLLPLVQHSHHPTITLFPSWQLGWTADPLIQSCFLQGPVPLGTQ